MDLDARAKEICDGIVDPGFIAELDRDVMAFRAECARIGSGHAAEAIFRAADDDPGPDRWTHAEALAAWALQETPPID